MNAVLITLNEDYVGQLNHIKTLLLKANKLKKRIEKMEGISQTENNTAAIVRRAFSRGFSMKGTRKCQNQN